VLVSGSTGFIGRHLVPTLARRFAVRAAARDRSLARVPAAAEISIVPDLAGPVDWRPLLSGAGAVVHLAGIAHAGPQIPDAAYDQVNAVATANLAAAARQARVQRLVYISSIRAQSGPVAEHILTETDEARPTDAYGRSKLAAEAAIAASGVPYTILRPVLVYGAGVKGNLARLLRIAASPIPLPFGAFDNRRSLLGVENLADAIHFVLATPSTEGQTYIVADPQPIMFRNIVAALRRGFGRRPGMYTVPKGALGLALRCVGKSEAWGRFGGELVADPSKLIEAGWSPGRETAVALETMARSLIAAQPVSIGKVGSFAHSPIDPS
jgi:UDP-glucose 4-epimerase